jgi:uncharacterized protein YjbK
MEKALLRNDIPTFLNEKQFNAILQDFAKEKLEKQGFESLCFDTEDLQLWSQRYVMRVKNFENHLHDMSLIHIESKHYLKQEIISPASLEKIHKILFTDLTDEKKNEGPLHFHLKSLTRDNLIFIGKIITKRFVLHKEHVILKIDKNLFPDGTIRFELDLGLRTSDPQIIEEEKLNLWENHGITLSKNFVNKYEKLIEGLTSVAK